MTKKTHLPKGGWTRSFRFDLAIAVVLTALVQVQMWTASRGGELGPVGAGSALALLQTVPLIWRRTHPLPVFLITLVSASIPPVIGGWGDNAFGIVGPLIALYTVAAYKPLRLSLPSYLVAGLAATTLHQLPQVEGFDPVYLLLPWIPFGGGWFLGVQVRLRRKYAAALQDREAEIELQRHAEALEAVTRERTRIARELHDVVGHSLSIIAVQAGAARLNFDAQPETVPAALESIEETANQAADEMERLLSVIGGPDETTPEGRSLEDIEALVQSVRRAGVDVELRTEGEPHTLSPGLDLSAYRIVQEALTNIAKYAAGERAEVIVRYQPKDLELRVINHATKSAASSEMRGGHGLIGMRERVALFRGTFEAAPTGEGGFSVLARLPVEATG